MKKVIVKSNRPREYYFEIMKKKADGKKLNQRERVYTNLYVHEDLPCFFFFRQMKPAIMKYDTRIFELREMGFVIPAPKITYKNGQKHSIYNMDKEHMLQEVPNEPWWRNLFPIKFF